MNINKQALLEWIDVEIDLSSCNSEVEKAERWAFRQVKKAIESGRFDAPSDDRLRSLLERLDSYIDFSEHLSPGDWGIEDVTGINSLFDEMREALSTTEPTGAQQEEPDVIDRFVEAMERTGWRTKEQLKEQGITIPGINTKGDV